MTWCRIFDVASAAASSDILIFDWNSYADHDGIISIPKYVESHADYLRSRLIGLIYGFAAVQVAGKSVVEHLEITKGVSLWWMSLLVEKDLQKTPRLFDCLRLLALDDLLREARPVGVELVSDRKELAQAVKSLCVELEIAFRWERSSRAATKPPQTRLKCLYHSLPLSVQSVFWLGKHLVQRWALRRARAQDGLKTADCGDITVFSYFTHLDTESCSHGRFHSHQWNAVSELLNAASQSTNWFHHYFENPDMPDNIGLAWLANFNRDVSKQGHHLFVDSFLSVRTVLKVLYQLLALNVVARRLRKIENALAANRFPRWLWPLLRDDFNESVYGRTAAQNLLWCELFDEAIGSLPWQRLGVYLNENQSWERAMIYAWRKHGHGELIAVAHSTIRYWDLRYFEDAHAFDAKARLALPLPDKLAVNGPAARQAMVGTGYPRERLVEVEAQRYMGLVNLNTLKRNQTTGSELSAKFPGTVKKRVLVLGDIMQSSIDALMHLLQEQASELESEYAITLKQHPAAPLPAGNYPPLVYEITHEKLSHIIDQFDIALAANSTSAALDALLAGLKVVTHVSEGEINLSPLRGLEETKFVHTSKELMEALYDSASTAPYTVVANYFWLDPGLPRWRALLGVSISTGELI